MLSLTSLVVLVHAQLNLIFVDLGTESVLFLLLLVLQQQEIPE